MFELMPRKEVVRENTPLCSTTNGLEEVTGAVVATSSPVCAEANTEESKRDVSTKVSPWGWTAVVATAGDGGSIGARSGAFTWPNPRTLTKNNKEGISLCMHAPLSAS